MEKDKDIIRTSLRLPKSIYDHIDRAASEKGVTMHSEILSRLASTVVMDAYIPSENAHSDEITDTTEEIIERVIRRLAQEGLLKDSTHD